MCQDDFEILDLIFFRPSGTVSHIYFMIYTYIQFDECRFLSYIEAWLTKHSFNIPLTISKIPISSHVPTFFRLILSLILTSFSFVRIFTLRKIFIATISSKKFRKNACGSTAEPSSAPLWNLLLALLIFILLFSLNFKVKILSLRISYIPRWLYHDN